MEKVPFVFVVEETVKVCVPPVEEVKVFEAGETLRFGSGDTVIVPALGTVAVTLIVFRPFLRTLTYPLPSPQEEPLQVTVGGGTEVPLDELHGSRLSLELLPVSVAAETTFEFSFTFA